MQPDNNREITFDVMEFVLRLLRRWFVLLICGVIVGGGAFVYNKFFVTPLYEANCRMIVITREDANDNVTQDQLTSAEGMIKTYTEIIKGRDFLEQVIGELGYSKKEMTYNQLRSMVSISAVTDTQIMKISVRDSNINRAKAIARVIYTNAPEYTKSKGKVGALEQLDRVYAENSSVYPNTTKNTALGFFIGLMIPVFIIALMMLMENTYKNDYDLKQDLDLPVLGIIPALDPKEAKRKREAEARSNEKEAQ